MSFLSLYVRECICSRARRGDFETKKRKKKKKKKTRSFVRSFALVRRREQTKHRRGETRDENFLAPKKKNEGGANSKKFSPRRRSDTFLSFSVLTLPLGGAFLVFTTPARAEREEERIKFCQSFCFGKKF